MIDKNKQIVIEGDKGCFAEGTTISTPLGPKLIEDIVIGDTVLAYDKTGYISNGIVTETFHHDTNHTQDDFVVVKHTNGEFTITTNHWVWLADGGFVEAGDLTTLDYVVLEDGKISKVISVVAIARLSHSYNFTVTPHHTYIANNVRVHNKGSSKSSSAAPRAAVEDPNTLRSRQTARVLNVLSEGEIEGVEETYFDDTPIGNFYGAFVDSRAGTSSQAYIAGFSDIESEQNVDVIIRNDLPPVIRAVSTIGIDAMRVTLQVDALWSQDTTNGDMHGETVTLRVSSRPAGGIWSIVTDSVITGKTLTPYRRAIRVESPDDGVSLWEVKVERITQDYDINSRQAGTRWTTYTEIQDVKLTYDDTALVGVVSDADSTGGKIPRMSFHIKGVKVFIPDNYDPLARTYSGNWNGNFYPIVQYTNNPAWVLYDVLTNERYGLNLSSDYIDKFSFYQASVYNDSLVASGTGAGFEPIFTFNGVIQQRQEAFRIVQTIAASMRAVLMEVGGVVKLIQDRPTDQSIILTNNDVADGMFEYRSAGLKAMHTSVNVTFNDPNDRYLTRTVTEEDSDGIARYGLNTTDIVAFGCTSEGQARRHAKWILDTELNNEDNVLFHVGMNKVFMEPGDVISLMDDDYADVKHTGKILSATANTVTFDRELFLESETFTLVLVGADGTTVDEYNIVETNGFFTTVSVFGAWNSIPNTNSSFILRGDIVPRPFKVVSVLDQEDDTFEVVGNFYDPDKYDRVINGIVNEVPTYTTIGGYEVSAPSNPLVTNEGYYLNGVRKQQIRLEWTPPIETDLALTYTVMWSRNNLPWNIINGVSQPLYEIEDAIGGSYQFIITAVNLRGVTSLPLKFSVDIEFTDATGEGDVFGDLYPPINLRTLDGGGEFSGRDANFVWGSNSANDVVEDPIASWRVRIFDSTGETLLRTEIIDKDTITYTYTYSKNAEDHNGTPERTVFISVQALSVWNKVSVAATLTVSNPAPSAPTVTATGMFDSLLLKLIGTTTDTDFSHYIVCQSTDAVFEPTAANTIFEGNDVSYTILDDSGVPQYFQVAAVDGFWDGQYNSLIWTATVSAESRSPESQNEITIDGLTFSTLGDQVSWTTGQAHLSELDQPAQTNDINAGSYDWVSGKVYLYFIWGNSNLANTTDINVALATKYHRVLAIYSGGSDLQVREGGLIMDGDRLISGSVSAAQLSSGLLITNKAQIGTGVIEDANIKNATIGALQLVEGDITKMWTVSSGGINTATIVRTNVSPTAKVTVTLPNPQLMKFNVPSLSGVADGTKVAGFFLISYYLETVVDGEVPLLIGINTSLPITETSKGSSDIMNNINDTALTAIHYKGRISFVIPWEFGTGDAVSIEAYLTGEISGVTPGYTNYATVSMGKISVVAMARMR